MGMCTPKSKIDTQIVVNQNIKRNSINTCPNSSNIVYIYKNNFNLESNNSNKSNNSFFIRDVNSEVSTLDSNSQRNITIELMADIEETLLPIYLKKNKKVLIKIYGNWSFYSDNKKIDFLGYKNMKYNDINVGQLMMRVQGGKNFIINSNNYTLIPDSDGLLFVYANGDFISSEPSGSLSITFSGSFYSLNNYKEINKYCNWKALNNFLSDNEKFFFPNNFNSGNTNEGLNFLNIVNMNCINNNEINTSYCNNQLRNINNTILNLQKEEFFLFELINKVRTNPKQFAEQFVDKYNSDNIELYNFLINYTPIGTLNYSDNLTKAAKEHCYDLGNNGLNGHISSNGIYNIFDRIKKYSKIKDMENYYFGECLCFGKRKRLSILLNLLKDNNLKYKQNRFNILNEKFTQIGICIYYHTIYKWGCVIDLGTDI